MCSLRKERVFEAAHSVLLSTFMHVRGAPEVQAREACEPLEMLGQGGDAVGANVVIAAES